MVSKHGDCQGPLALIKPNGKNIHYCTATMTVDRDLYEEHDYHGLWSTSIYSDSPFYISESFGKFEAEYFICACTCVCIHTETALVPCLPKHWALFKQK